MTFKAVLFSLSNVLPEKQKLMVKGKVMKDDDPLTKFTFKDGITLMMMGTAEEQMLKEPEKPIKFLEDMTPAERAKALNEKAALIKPAGLVNLGNTCYMNSVMQCMKRVNELKDAMTNMPAPTREEMMGGAVGPEKILTYASGRVFKSMEIEEFSHRPMEFINVLRRTFPMYDERDQHGHHKQQDADEALMSVLSAWRGPLQQASGKDLIGDLFEFELKNTLTNTEMPDEVTE